MHELTALEIGIVVSELKGKTEGSYLKKFYDLGNDSFKMVFYKDGRNTVVYCRLGVTFNESTFSEESGPATNFAMAVRKRIEGARVAGIEQYRSDRIIVLHLSNNRQEYRLVFEMFGQGNLVLINQENRIELAYKIISFKDRSVKPRLPYLFPESSFIDIHTATRKEVDSVLERMSGSDDKLIVALSRYINIGPIYLEEVIRRAGLDPKGKAGKADLEGLRESLTRFVSELRQYRAREYLTAVGRDYSVIPLSKYAGAESKEYGSLSELLDNVYLGERTAVEDKSAKAIEELDANIRKQLQLVKSLEEESVESKATGNKIFERMNEINQLIEYMRSRKRVELKELQEQFPHLKVKSIDLKNKTVGIELN